MDIGRQYGQDKGKPLGKDPLKVKRSKPSKSCGANPPPMTLGEDGSIPWATIKRALKPND